LCSTHLRALRQVGIALEYRLVFEREWHLPADASPDRLIDEMLDFLREALDTAMQQELSPARRELMRTASEAVRDLAACLCKGDLPFIDPPVAGPSR
jgi:hypothetical protein